MKRIFFYIAGFCCMFNAHAQMHQYNTNFTLSEKNFVDTVAIEYENDQIYVPVIIQGKKYRFNLDTGSSQGLLYTDTQIPNLQELGNVISHDANGVTDTIKVVQLPSLMLGHQNINGYVASIVKKPIGKVNYDGIIGFDIFNKGIGAKIDPKNKIMILSDRKHYFDHEAGQTLKYNLKWFVPYIMVSPFMRHTDEVLFDTGAKQLYQMNRESFMEHRYKSKQVNAQVEGEATGNFTVATNSTEKQDKVYFLNLNRLKWNEFAFKNVRTITTQGASRIGSQLFNYGSIVINPKKKRITFQPYNNSDSVNVSNKQFGVAFIEKENQPYIGLIWHKSEAYKNGMRQGDIVLKIDNEPINSYQEFIDYPFTTGKKYKFVLQDPRGFKKEVFVTR